MNRQILTAMVIVTASLGLIGGCKKKAEQTAEAPQAAPAMKPVSTSTQMPMAEATSGEELFKKHCATCHPDGGNIVKPDFTLHSAALKKHNITKPEDIVKNMRNPGPGMTTFDEKTLPDKEATAIAEYVLKHF